MPTQGMGWGGFCSTAFLFWRQWQTQIAVPFTRHWGPTGVISTTQAYVMYVCKRAFRPHRNPLISKGACMSKGSFHSYLTKKSMQNGLCENLCTLSWRDKLYYGVCRWLKSKRVNYEKPYDSMPHKRSVLHQWRFGNTFPIVPIKWTLT